MTDHIDWDPNGTPFLVRAEQAKWALSETVCRFSQFIVCCPPEETHSFFSRIIKDPELLRQFNALLINLKEAVLELEKKRLEPDD